MIIQARKSTFPENQNHGIFLDYNIGVRNHFSINVENILAGKAAEFIFIVVQTSVEHSSKEIEIL